MENTKISKLKMLGYNECVKSHYSLLNKDTRIIVVAEDGNSIEVDTKHGVEDIRKTKFSNGAEVLTFRTEESTDELKVTCNGIRRTSVGVAHIHLNGRELNDGVYEAEFSKNRLKIISATELANTYYLELEFIDKINGKSIKRSVDFGEHNIFNLSRLDRLTPFYDFMADELRIQMVEGSSFNNSVILLPSFIISLKRNTVYPRNYHDKIIEDIDTGEIYGLASKSSAYKITNFSSGGTYAVQKETTNTITFLKRTIRYRIAILETHTNKDIQNDKIYDPLK